MKNFYNYLVETSKIYEFKVGIAGNKPDNFEDTLETILQKYGLDNMSNGKSTPIQERPLDFPQLQNIDVTYYDIKLRYPTVPSVLAEYISNSCGICRTHVMVRTPNAPQEEYQKQEEPTEYTTLLKTEDMGGTSAQDSVGQNRVMELLKELEKSKKDRTIDPASGVGSKAVEN